MLILCMCFLLQKTNTVHSQPNLVIHKVDIGPHWMVWRQSMWKQFERCKMPFEY